MAFSQGTIKGTVTDAATGEALPGANVIVEGQPYGGASDLKGEYMIEGVPVGTYTITASVIGYEKASQTVAVASGITVSVNFGLNQGTLMGSSLEVLASRATRQTPVAYTDVDKSEMAMRLGSRDIPLILSTTPSVYATEQGGGAGDARVSVRGFNQRNVAIMINGVPVNDMENGWVYWSNWDGVADATSSIQMQRGLSAVNLAAPSIGGTMNILTDPATHAKGGMYKKEMGSGNFTKETISYHSGMVNDRLAFGGTIVRKTGDGVIDRAWTDAWAYYFGLSYAATDNNRFEFYALGAPQRHGQMRYAQNLAAYDSTYAKEVFDQAAIDSGAIDAFSQASAGRLYNENWNVVDPNYSGKQYFYMYGDKVVDRYSPYFLNENENYYHKPQVNLNWYWTINDKMRLSSIIYYSGGSGGGTGTFDDMLWDYSGPSRAVNFNGTIDMNQSALDRKGNAKTAGQSVGFLRNSINRQWTIGAISKFNYTMSEALKIELGIDWRTAEIEHNREVRDLLGGSYAVNGDYDPYAGAYDKFYNEFDWVMVNADSMNYAATLANAADKKLGDVIDYNNTNTVDWTGFFAQAEYKTSLYSLYGMGGYSMVKYGLTDHFKKAANHPASYVDANDKGELVITSDYITAVQFKTGGLYRFTENMDVYANFGYVQKVPILDNIIDDIDIALAPDPTNEKFISTELGLNFKALAGRLAAKINLYNTNWKDRNVVKPVSSGQGTSGDTDIIFLTGVNEKHQGFELELALQPMRFFRLDGAVSIGNWLYTDDAIGEYKDTQADTTATYTYALKDLKVGDAPQTQYSVSGSFFPIKGLTVQGTWHYFDRYWANWEPSSREVAADGTADRAQNWQVPAYSVIDAHVSYTLPTQLEGLQIQLFAHIFNVTDAIYVSDALDNSQYNAFSGDGVNHKADDAEVYVGAPRRVNAGVTVRF
ncbi:MAG: TonB-dependent receptor [Candidatus Marinimicrobia bacterium]|nr:TonB-dependent receptor [Candidatus Neomarinimicrobiota bacterium]MCF7841182.1 TonB-dependent receptor [Candidatus Neomarinimicrobiota bacterium]